MRYFNLKRSFLSPSPRARKSNRSGRSTTRLRLECLEDRTLLSPYIVTTTADSGAGSLRDAITQINADTNDTRYINPNSPNQDEIDFDITAASDTGGGFNSTTGIATISPKTVLPKITTAVSILGASEPPLVGSSLATGMIALDGTLAGGTKGGAALEINAPNCYIAGFSLINWGEGIQVDAVDNTDISDDFIGVGADGKTAGGNLFGVNVLNGATKTTIGFNVIAANSDDGIVTAAPADISGNAIGEIGISPIGLSPLGTDSPNQPALPVDAHGNPVIQGTGIGTGGGIVLTGSGAAKTTIELNEISGNVFGIDIGNASSISVTQNGIGESPDGTDHLGNAVDGVLVTGSSGITISKNTIGDNLGDAVGIDPKSQQVSIQSNSIAGNGKLGIDLQSGANGNQAAPQLNSASRPSSTSLTVSGSLKAAANTTYQVEFFTNPSNNNPQGQTSIGTQSVTTDANGSATFTAMLTVPKSLGATFITATATDPNGNTSQFSAAVAAPAPSSPSSTPPLTREATTGFLYWQASRGGLLDLGVEVQVLSSNDQPLGPELNLGLWGLLTNPGIVPLFNIVNVSRDAAGDVTIRLDAFGFLDIVLTFDPAGDNTGFNFALV